MSSLFCKCRRAHAEGRILAEGSQNGTSTRQDTRSHQAHAKCTKAGVAEGARTGQRGLALAGHRPGHGRLMGIKVSWLGGLGRFGKAW